MSPYLASEGPNTNRIPVAKWTVDGKVWTSSGVSAGIDAILAFVGAVYGRDPMDEVVALNEYDRHRDPPGPVLRRMHRRRGQDANTSCSRCGLGVRIRHAFFWMAGWLVCRGFCAGVWLLE